MTGKCADVPPRSAPKTLCPPATRLTECVVGFTMTSKKNSTLKTSPKFFKVYFGYCALVQVKITTKIKLESLMHYTFL